MEDIKFKNKLKAQEAVCESFVALGALAGINASNGCGPVDVDEDLISACHEAYFSDPHFLGGPACFHYAQTLEKVERIFESVFNISERLCQYIEHEGNPKKTKAAERSMAVIASAYAWMKKVTAAG
jgi:hypothetical protein